MPTNRISPKIEKASVLWGYNTKWGTKSQLCIMTTHSSAEIVMTDQVLIDEKF